MTGSALKLTKTVQAAITWLHQIFISSFGCHGDMAALIIITMATEEAGPGCRRDHLYCTLRQLDIKTETFPFVETLNLDINSKASFRKGIFCKNLFLKDRRGQFYLVIIPENQNVDLKYLKQTVRACRNLNLGKAEDLRKLLNVEAGCVTPFGILHDQCHPIRVIIDSSLTNPDELLNFHPFVPWLTTVIKFSDLNKFVTFCGYHLEVIHLV